MSDGSTICAPTSRKNGIWIEDDDKMLIEAHRYYRNRWSSIARHLPGRSENAVKNHWNASLHSLKAKRRLKKKKSEQAPPGQFSILEEYICSLYLEDAAKNHWNATLRSRKAKRGLKKKSEHAPPGQFSILEEYIHSLYLEDAVPEAPPPSSASLPHHLTYGDLFHPAALAPAPAASSIPTNTEMSFNSDNSVAASSSNLGMINLNMPPMLPDLNYPMYVPVPAPQLQLAPQDPRQAYSNLNLSPYADYFTLLRTDLGRYHADAGASSSNPVANGYYNEAGHGGGGGRRDPADYTNVVVELASREFLTPSNDKFTLDLTRFK